MPTIAEMEFHKDMIRTADRMTREIHYNPTRFCQMINDHGGVEAARILIARTDPSDGFTRLWEAKHLEWSCEAFALLPWYQNLFSGVELQNARGRLDDYGFDIVAFENSAASRIPAWFEQESSA
jgi:hypothetical protein